MTTYRYTAIIEQVVRPARASTIEAALVDRLEPFGFNVVEVTGPEPVDDVEGET